MSTNLEAALLQDIQESPGDDAPRAAYADLLQDRGDPRGEFIAIQLKRSQLPATHEQQTVLAAEEANLLQRHGAEWMGPALQECGAMARVAHLLDKTQYALFERGFIEHVSLSVRNYLRHAAALAQQHDVLKKVRLLNVNRSRRWYEHFAKCEAIKSLEQIDLQGHNLHSNVLGTLFPNVPHALRRLILTNNSLFGYLSLRTLQRLEHLDLCLNAYGRQHDEDIVDNVAAMTHHLPELRRLDLRYNDLPDTTISAIQEESRRGVRIIGG